MSEKILPELKALVVNSLDYEISCMAISPGGGEIAVGGADGKIRLYDVRTGSLLDTFGLQNTGSVNSVAISPNNMKIAAVYVDGRIVIWQPGSIQGVNHEADILATDMYGTARLSFSSCGNKLISVSDSEGKIRIWDVVFKACLRIVSFDDPIDARFSPDDKNLVVVCAQGVIVFSVKRWSFFSSLWPFGTKRFHSHTRYLSSRFTPSGDQLICGDEDGVIQIIDLRAKKKIHEYYGHSFKRMWTSFSPNGRFFAAVSLNNKLIIRELASGEVMRNISMGETTRRISMSTDARYLVHDTYPVGYDSDPEPSRVSLTVYDFGSSNFGLEQSDPLNDLLDQIPGVLV
jgi:WD40 repeat protein